jgi:hypothetical protein
MRKTKLISMSEYCPTSKYPRNKRELIQNVVNRESEIIYPDQPEIVPQRLIDAIKPSPGLWNMFRNNVESFVMEFRP